jgi:hypothetical protein
VVGGHQIVRDDPPFFPPIVGPKALHIPGRQRPRRAPVRNQFIAPEHHVGRRPALAQVIVVAVHLVGAHDDGVLNGGVGGLDVHGV